MAVLLALLCAASLTAASVETCQQALATDLNQTIPIILGKTHEISALEHFTYSGKSYNDLGHYSTCIRTPDSTYFILRHQIERLSLLFGVCVPSSCSESDLQTMLNAVIADNGLEAKGISVHVEPPATFPVSGWFVFVIIWIIVLVILGIIGSIVDIKEEQYKANAITFRSESSSDALLERPREPTMIRIVKCFSLYTNTKKLFTSRSAEKTGSISTLECLNGVRVISMAWVIMGHVFAFRAASAFINFEEVQIILARWWTALAFGAFFAVDTFFWLSGLLMGYLTLVELDKRKGRMSPIGWAFIYIHRYFRILPLYVFCLLAYMYLIPPLGTGPLWSQIKNMSLGCEEYWWTNLLFVNNFVPDGIGNTCFGIGWYLANDMQCFWVAPLLIYLYYKYPKKISWMICTALIAACAIVTMVICSENGFKTMFIADVNDRGDFHKKIYIKPYCRLAPYVLGLYCGYIYFHYMSRYGGLQTNIRKDALANFVLDAIKETQLGKFFSFALGLGLILFFILVQLDTYGDWRTNYSSWSSSENVLFLGVEHIGFALGLVFLMMPLLLGELPFIWTLLAHPFWTPMARLTFSCFMGHYGLMTFMYAAEDYGVVFNQMVFYSDWLYANVASWLLAFPLSLLVEVPFGYLEKMICDSLKGGKREAAK